ncbi:DUF3099 domain-containing protein [uncultured Pseudokineococcus sp.]|uniref:DUF3099 domain-containing protein n=1 Tax=uncultured Pseudokineococcus sp. TaxID=1642928 RepID=UPI00260AB1B0|nr:DUF3099 domain-containing protein [uncultured Pseudokineococcus sp.]
MGNTSAAGAHRTAPGTSGRVLPPSPQSSSGRTSSGRTPSGQRGPWLRRDDASVQRITTAPVGQRVHQQQQIGRYLLSMGVRTGCFVLAVLVAVSGGSALMWLTWVLVGLAVVLPYVAVLVANAGRETVKPTSTQVTAPLQPALTSAPARPAEEPLVGHVAEGPRPGEGAQDVGATWSDAPGGSDGSRRWDTERLRPPAQGSRTPGGAGAADDPRRVA